MRWLKWSWRWLIFEYFSRFLPSSKIQLIVRSYSRPSTCIVAHFLRLSRSNPQAPRLASDPQNVYEFSGAGWLLDNPNNRPLSHLISSMELSRCLTRLMSMVIGPIGLTSPTV